MTRTTHFNSASVAARIDAERRRFIESIADRDVLQLALSHNPLKGPCFLFQPTIHGRYNICYFVEFGQSQERWVVRVPIRPCLARGGRSKLTSEVTAMKFLATHTDIPIPTIRAYSLHGNDGPLSNYLILDYVGGTQLSSIDLRLLNKEQKTHFYTSMAKVLIQLRRQSFPSFGTLYLAGGTELWVTKDILTKDINVQELEGLDPRRIQQQCYGNRGFLPTATHYTETLIRTAYNAFFKGTDSVDPDMVDSSLFHLDLFRQHANIWLDPTISSFQCCLTHGDLAPHNILVDESTMAITAVLDWGWSRVVPIQYFLPPLWLNQLEIADLAWKHSYDAYVSREFNDFLTIIKSEEYSKYKNEMLAEQWEKTKHDGGFLIGHALENWQDIDAVAFRYLNARYYGGTADLEGRVKRFLEDDPLRMLVIEMKENQARCNDTDKPQMTATAVAHGSRVTRKLWPTPTALQGSMMLITTGLGYGLWRLALASARRPPRI